MHGAKGAQIKTSAPNRSEVFFAAIETEAKTFPVWLQIRCDCMKKKKLIIFSNRWLFHLLLYAWRKRNEQWAKNGLKINFQSARWGKLQNTEDWWCYSSFPIHPFIPAINNACGWSIHLIDVGEPEPATLNTRVPKICCTYERSYTLIITMVTLLTGLGDKLSSIFQGIFQGM